MTADHPDLDARVQRYAQAIDPDAFDETRPRSKAQVAIIQWAARRKIAIDAATAILPLVDAETERLRAENKRLRADWSSPLARKERWHNEPNPHPRYYLDLYDVQRRYLRAIECSSNGPTPDERAELINGLLRDVLPLVYWIEHLHADVKTAQSESDKATQLWHDAREDVEDACEQRDEARAALARVTHILDQAEQDEAPYGGTVIAELIEHLREALDTGDDT